MIIKRCNKCGALVKAFKDCTCDDCGIKCCDEQMKTLVPNSTDASFEKHVPEYEIVNDEILVRVNHVMEEDHYIEWVAYSFDNKEYVVYFKPGEEAKATFPYVEGATIYSYCNKHALWSKEVK